MGGHLWPKKCVREFERTPLVEITGNISMFFWWYIHFCGGEKLGFAVKFSILGKSNPNIILRQMVFDLMVMNPMGSNPHKKHQQKNTSKRIVRVFLHKIFHLIIYIYIHQKTSSLFVVGKCPKRCWFDSSRCDSWSPTPRTPSSKTFLSKFFVSNLRG